MARGRWLVPWSLTVIAGTSSPGPVAPVFAAGGTISDHAVALVYPADHWGSLPYTRLTGTEPVASTSILYQSGWWYRVNGVDTREYPLPAPSGGIYSGPYALLASDNVDGKGFDAREEVDVYDNQRPSGTFRTSLDITNNTSAPLDLTLFHYLDADADGTSEGDLGEGFGSFPLLFASWTLTFTGVDTQGQYRAFGRTPALRANGWMVRPWPQIRALLNDTSIDNLTNDGVPFGPGDWTAAYQWNVTIPAGVKQTVAEVVVSSRVPSRSVKGDLMEISNQADVLFWDPAAGMLEVWEMRGATLDRPWSGLGFEELREPVGVDDFDGDYQNELVVRDLATAQIYFQNAWTNALTPLTGALPLSANWKLSATADFNHDGRPDLLWRNTTSQKLVIWKLGEGAAGTQKTGNIIPAPDHAVDSNWEVVGAQDFDNDGNVDLLWYNATSGNVVIWYMDAAVVRLTGGFTTPASAGDANWRVVATADYGKGPDTGTVPVPWGAPDILWRNQTSGKLVIWHMNWSGQRTAGVFTTPDSPGALAWHVVGPR